MIEMKEVCTALIFQDALSLYNMVAHKTATHLWYGRSTQHLLNIAVENSKNKHLLKKRERQL
jgi:hypothetical protein